MSQSLKRRDLRIVRGDASHPFSTGALVEALQTAGLPTDEAIRVARDLEKHYRNKGRKRIDHDDLMRRLVDKVRDAAGEGVADRLAVQPSPFLDLRVQTADGSEAFSRRRLVGSLERTGLSFKEASSAATQVEQALRVEGLDTVSERELAHVVANVVESRYGREQRLRYENVIDQPTDLTVVEPDGSRLPYSRGVLARSLMGVGLEPELSHQLARTVEDRFWRDAELEVDRRRLREVVIDLLRGEAGDDYAHRYVLMHDVRRSEASIQLLLGGAPGVGKSTVAAELGYRLGIPRLVSTDAIRQALRSLIGSELSPVLHSSSYTAWRSELLPADRLRAKPKRKRVIRGFQAQVQQLGTAIGAIMERSRDEATSLVMEGIHLVPGISPADLPDSATVIELVLAVADKGTHRGHLQLREGETHLRRRGEAYLQHFEEIRIIHDFVVARARAEGVPVIEASDVDQAVDGAIEHVLAALLSGEPAELRLEATPDAGVGR